MSSNSNSSCSSSRRDQNSKEKIDEPTFSKNLMISVITLNASLAGVWLLNMNMISLFLLIIALCISVGLAQTILFKKNKTSFCLFSRVLAVYSIDLSNDDAIRKFYLNLHEWVNNEFQGFANVVLLKDKGCTVAVIVIFYIITRIVKCLGDFGTLFVVGNLLLFMPIILKNYSEKFQAILKQTIEKVIEITTPIIDIILEKKPKQKEQ